MSLDINSRQVVEMSDNQSFVGGIKKLYDAVSSTYGPGGKTVIIERQHGMPLITKDGVTVSRSIDLEDPLEQMAVKIIKESAEKTLREAGDGTTTTIILASNLYKMGISEIHEKQYNVSQYKTGMLAAGQEIIRVLDIIKEPISNKDDVLNIAKISSNGDEILSTIISEAFDIVGKDGIITTSETAELTDKIEVKEGYNFNRGYLNPAFINNSTKLTSELDNPYILVLENPLSNLGQISTLIEKVRKTKRPLVILGDSFEGDTVPMLALNNVQTDFKNVAIMLPGVGEDKLEYAKDIAAYTNATSVNSVNGLRFVDLQLEHLGECKKIIVEENKTTILVDENTDENFVLSQRKDKLSTAISVTTSDHQRHRLTERLGQLEGKVVNVKLSARSSSELKEKRDRFDDAVEACRAALKDGIVAGSTASLVYVYFTQLKNYFNYLDTTEKTSFHAGFFLVIKNLLKPLSVLFSNAGCDDKTVSLILGKLDSIYLDNEENLPYGFTFNVFTHEMKHYKESNIIDPVTVVKSAVSNSISVASTLLTTGYSVPYTRK